MAPDWLWGGLVHLNLDNPDNLANPDNLENSKHFIETFILSIKTNPDILYILRQKEGDVW